MSGTHAGRRRPRRPAEAIGRGVEHRASARVLEVTPAIVERIRAGNVCKLVHEGLGGEDVCVRAEGAKGGDPERQVVHEVLDDACLGEGVWRGGVAVDTAVRREVRRRRRLGYRVRAVARARGTCLPAIRRGPAASAPRGCRCTSRATSSQRPRRGRDGRKARPASRSCRAPRRARPRATISAAPDGRGARRR